MLGRIVIAAALIGFLNPQITAAQTPQLAGSWVVTSTLTNDYTCHDLEPGDITAYVWIVSSRTDGTVSVNVQGETSFPDLEGRWDNSSRTLTLVGDSNSTYSQTSWFKLSLDGGRRVFRSSPAGEAQPADRRRVITIDLQDEDPNTLRGVRRFLSANQSSRSRACFADFAIVAKRQ